MTANYKLVAVPFIACEEDTVRLETVTFIAASASGSIHKWWCINVGSFERDFQRIISPELARHAVERLKAGETFEFPNMYELSEVKGGFGGRWE